LSGGKIKLAGHAETVIEPAEALTEPIIIQPKIELAGVKEKSRLTGLSEHMNSRPQSVNAATLIAPAAPGSPAA
jgi:hypothetical protein